MVACFIDSENLHKFLVKMRVKIERDLRRLLLDPLELRAVLLLLREVEQLLPSIEQSISATVSSFHHVESDIVLIEYAFFHVVVNGPLRFVHPLLSVGDDFLSMALTTRKLVFESLKSLVDGIDGLHL